MKRYCTSNSFKPITNFYFYNFHGYGYREIDCKKPNFVSNNENSRMFKNTKPASNKRGRSQNRSNDREKPNGERKKVIY